MDVVQETNGAVFNLSNSQTALQTAVNCPATSATPLVQSTVCFLMLKEILRNLLNGTCKHIND